jgi:sulfatase maturation enzyme AslB (radical SAM superfamily)
MCSGYFSSAIAQEEAELFDNTSSVKSALRSKQRKSSLKEILSYLPSAEKIYFAGGEPLLSSEHYEILQTLIDCGNTDLEIFYNTNFTTLQYQKISVLDLWGKFSNIKIGASLDATGPVAEYVRHGTDWKTIELNLNLVKTRCPHVNFTVTSTVGLLNISSLIDLQKQWHASGTLDLSKFSMEILISPDHLSLCALPPRHKQRLEQIINHHIVWCEGNSAIKLATQWKDVLTYMWSKDNSHCLSEFRRLTNSMDVYRKESLAQAIPELADLIEENIS